MFYGLPKDLTAFFTNFDICQVVILRIVNPESSSPDDTEGKRFICNSLVLAIHSEKFRQIIADGAEEIPIRGFCSPGGVDTVRHCIEFTYGNRSGIMKLKNFGRVGKFSEIWNIPAL